MLDLCLVLGMSHDLRPAHDLDSKCLTQSRRVAEI
jgi:hypothetical protein